MNENVYEYELCSNKRPKLRVHYGFKIHFKFTIWLYRLSVFGHSNKKHDDQYQFWTCSLTEYYNVIIVITVDLFEPTLKS